MGRLGVEVLGLEGSTSLVAPPTLGGQDVGEAMRLGHWHVALSTSANTHTP